MFLEVTLEYAARERSEQSNGPAKPFPPASPRHRAAEGRFRELRAASSCTTHRAPWWASISRGCGDRQPQTVRFGQGEDTSHPETGDEGTGHASHHLQADGPPHSRGPSAGAGPWSSVQLSAGDSGGFARTSTAGVFWDCAVPGHPGLSFQPHPVLCQIIPLCLASWLALLAGFTPSVPFLCRSRLSLQETFCTIDNIFPPLNLLLCWCSNGLRPASSAVSGTVSSPAREVRVSPGVSISLLLFPGGCMCSSQ